MGSLSNDMEDTEATPAMPTTVLQSVLLKSARSQCEGVRACAPAFARLLDFLFVHLLFGWAKVQGSPCTSFLVNTRLLSLRSSLNSIVTVRKWLPIPEFLLI